MAALELRVRAQASDAPLARLDIWVDDVPVFSSRGVDVGEHETREVERTLEMELGAGENHLQVSVTDRTRVESRCFNRNVVCERDRPPSSRWNVVAVGVSHYRDESMNLRYAAKGARDVARLFSEAAGPHTEPAEMHLLTDGDATREAILALREPLGRTAIDDKVLVLFAGHGQWVDLDYYLAPTDTDFSRFGETALRFATSNAWSTASRPVPP